MIDIKSDISCTAQFSLKFAEIIRDRRFTSRQYNHAVAKQVTETARSNLSLVSFLAALFG